MDRVRFAHPGALATPPAASPSHPPPRAPETPSSSFVSATSASRISLSRSRTSSAHASDPSTARVSDTGSVSDDHPLPSPPDSPVPSSSIPPPGLSSLPLDGTWIAGPVAGMAEEREAVRRGDGLMRRRGERGERGEEGEWRRRNALIPEGGGRKGPMLSVPCVSHDELVALVVSRYGRLSRVPLPVTGLLDPVVRIRFGSVNRPCRDATADLRGTDGGGAPGEGTGTLVVTALTWKGVYWRMWGMGSSGR